MLRLVRYISIVLLLTLAVGWGMIGLATWRPNGFAASLVHQVTNSVPGGRGLTARLQVGGPFSLIDMRGASVSDRSWPGTWKLIYFGYTYCPDVCPTELQTISSALDQLGPDAAKVTPLFVTIDPERDTPQALAEYVKLFDPRLVGLTGNDQQIATIAREYRVYYSRVTQKGSSSYLMDHSSFVYLMDKDGMLKALIQPGISAEAMAATIRAQMAAVTG